MILIKEPLEYITHICELKKKSALFTCYFISLGHFKLFLVGNHIVQLNLHLSLPLYWEIIHTE